MKIKRFAAAVCSLMMAVNTAPMNVIAAGIPAAGSTESTAEIYVPVSPNSGTPTLSGGVTEVNENLYKFSVTAQELKESPNLRLEITLSSEEQQWYSFTVYVDAGGFYSSTDGCGCGADQTVTESIYLNEVIGGTIDNVEPDEVLDFYVNVNNYDVQIENISASDTDDSSVEGGLRYGKTLSWNYNYDEDTFEERYTLDPSAYIICYEGSGGSVTIPATLGGYSVRNISRGAFSGNTDITELVLAEGLELENSYDIFYGMTSLETVTVEGYTYIDNSGLGYYKDSVTGDDNKTDLLIKCNTSSSAASYAENNGFRVEYLDCITVGDYIIRPDNEDDSEKTAYLIKYIGSDNELTIPEELGGYRISGLNGSVFTSAGQKIKKLTIPDTVEYISYNAFQGCDELEDIVFPENVNIDRYAVEGTPWYQNKLASGELIIAGATLLDGRNVTGKVVIPDNVRYISDNAFENNTKITEVVLNDGLERIGYGAFCGCTSLHSTEIPDSVYSIEDNAFGYRYEYEDVSGEMNFIKDDSFLIIGGYDSTARSYANEYGFEFKANDLIEENGYGYVIYPYSGGYWDENDDWIEVEEDRAKLVYYTGSDSAVELPGEIGGYTVSALTSDFFKNSPVITDLTVPESLTNIEEYSLKNSNVTTLRVGSSFWPYSAWPGVSYNWEEGVYEVNDAMTIYCPYDSSAANFAAEYGVRCIYTDCETEGDFQYKLYDEEDEGVYVVKYMGDSKNVVIPETLGGKKVTVIGSNAFRGNTVMQSLKIPEGVTRIYWGAFRNCSALTDIEFPESLEDIDLDAVMDSLWYDTLIENGQMVIAGNFLLDGSAVSGDVVIPEGVKRIKDGAFEENNNITSVKLNEGLEYIEYRAFAGCENLKKIEIPESVENISNANFGLRIVWVQDDEWTSHSEEELIEGVVIYCYPYSGGYNYAVNYGVEHVLLGVETEGDYLYIINEDDEAQIVEYKGSSAKVTVPDTLGGKPVTKIGQNAFRGHTEITEMVLSDNISRVERDALLDCTSLKRLEVPRKTYLAYNSVGYYTGIVDDGDGWTYEDTIKQDDFVIACYSGSRAYEYALDYDFEYELLGIITEGDYTYTADEYDEVTILKYSGSDTKVTVPDTLGGMPVTIISSNAFADNAKITEVTLPASVESIRTDAFKNCPALTKLVLEGQHVSMSYSCGAGILDSEDYSKTNKSFRIYGRYNNYSSKNYAEEYGFDYIVTDVFMSGDFEVVYDDSYNTPYLHIIGYKGSDSVVTVPAKIDGIPVSMVAYDTFGSNESITELIFEEGIREIYGSYNLLPNLKKVTLPGSQMYLSWNAFSGCENLEEVILGDGIENISYMAFSGCPKLKKLTVPESVTFIAWNALEGTPFIEELRKANNGLAILNGILFNGVEAKGDVVIPKTVKVISPYAFIESSLTSVEITGDLEMLPYGTFMNCTQMKKAVIRGNVDGFENMSMGFVEVYDEEEGYYMDAKTDGFTIYCYQFTEAEKYAQNNGFDIVYLDGSFKGDINGDSRVDLLDYAVLKSELAGVHQVDYIKANADIDGDGDVDKADLEKFANYLTGAIDKL
ncbi:MAG: leucine-rich repeat protein [Ruminococcus sp.]|nr:leucine-rich repeat protein [Ruminococcus sp.]